MYSRIVIALDGSDIAEGALVHASEFSKLFDAPLHLIRVADAYSLERVAGTGIGFDYVEMGSMLQHEIDAANAYIETTSKRLSDQGLEVTGTVVTGPISRSIVSQLNNGDLLVIVSHGRTGISRWFLGSVAEEVVRNAPVPVLLIRHSAGSAESQD